jgi:DNA-binding response OmpR family regulator
METNDLPVALLIDDEPFIHEFIKRCLQPKGFNVVVVTNGAEAMDFLSTTTPRIVLLDIELPAGESGLQVLQRIKKQTPELRVIMLTGVFDDQIGQLAHRYGASDYLTKPVDGTTLCRTLETHILLSL